MLHIRWISVHDKIYITILVTLIFQAQYSDSTEHRRPTREYLKMSVEERIRFLGYPCDVHDFTTPDGYHLRLYRVPYGVNPTKNFECDGEYIHEETGSDYVEGDYDEEYSDEDTDKEETIDPGDEDIGTTTETATSKGFTSSTLAKPDAITTATIVQPSPTMSTMFKKLFASTENVTLISTSTTPSPTTFATTSTSSTSKLNTDPLPSIPITLKPTESSTKGTFIQKIPKKSWRKPRKSNGGPNRNRNMINGENSTGKSVVLLLHGLTGGPSNFIYNGRDSLAFYFADRGFDVWILCFRGCQCGQKDYHEKYNTNDKEYWDFSLDHKAAIDVPEAIDYILPITNQSAVHIIGHSAGTIKQIIFLSERPEYASKLKIGSHYGGSVFIGRSDYPFLQFSTSWVKVFKGLHKFFGWTTVMPMKLIDLFMGFLVETCYSDEYFHICEGMNSMVASHHSVLIDKYASMPILFHDSQMHIAPKEAFHFMEMMATGECAKYDYGKKRNLREYGQETPPSYNFSGVTNPMILHFSENDHFGNLADLKRGVAIMPNVIQVYKVPFWRFTHTDYILGKNASKLVYENTCKMFKRYDAGERFKPLKEVDIDDEPLFY